MIDLVRNSQYPWRGGEERPAVTISHLPPEKCSRHIKIPQQLNHFPRAVKRKNNWATILQKTRRKKKLIEDHW